MCMLCDAGVPLRTQSWDQAVSTAQDKADGDTSDYYAWETLEGEFFLGWKRPDYSKVRRAYRIGSHTAYPQMEGAKVVLLASYHNGRA